MNIKVGKDALITCDNRLYPPDGWQYGAVHGTVEAVVSSAEALGIRTMAKSTNWYVEIGDMTITGCQIYYTINACSCSFGSAKARRRHARSSPIRSVRRSSTAPMGSESQSPL